MVEPTIEEYRDWKSSDVTKTFFQKVMERREDLKEVLAMSRGEDPEYLRGYCQALLDIANTDYQDMRDN